MLFMQADESEARAQHAFKQAIAGLVGLALAMGVGRFAFTPILPLMQADTGVTVTQGAWLAAANYLGYLVGALAALITRVKGRRVIRAALLATAVATLAMGLTDRFAAWLLLRFAAGFASAFLLVFISAWSLDRVSTRERPFLSAAVFSGVGVGIFVVGILCVGLELAGVRAANIWIALGALSLSIALALSHSFADDELVRAAAGPVDEHHSAPGAARWRLVVCYGLFGFGYIVPATFLPAMARSVMDTQAATDVSWPVFGLAAAVSTFAVAAIKGRSSGLQTWRSAQAVMAIGVALPVFSRAPAALIASALSVGGTFMVVTMLGMQTAKRFAATTATRLMAAMTAAFATGQLAGPLLVPYLVRSDDDFSPVLMIAAGMLLAGAWLLPSGAHGRDGKRSAAYKETAP